MLDVGQQNDYGALQVGVVLLLLIMSAQVVVSEQRLPPTLLLVSDIVTPFWIS